MAGHILITGAGGGIGSATARMAAARGYAVSLMARSSGSKEASALLGEIAAKGGEAQVVTADVTSEGDIVDAFKKAADRFGPRPASPTTRTNARRSARWATEPKKVSLPESRS